MKEEQFADTLTSSDSLKLFYRFVKPEKPKGVWVVAHGLGEHSGRYEHVIEAGADLGLAVYAMDMRGHGRSQGKKGFVEKFDQLVEDLDMLVELGRKNFPDVPLFLMGHSLGGLLSTVYTQTHPEKIAFLVLSSPALMLSMPVPPVKEIMGRFVSNWIPGLTMSNGLDPNLISTDPQAVKEYIADTLVHDRISARLFTEMTSAMTRALADASKIKAPLYIFHGTGDGIVSIQGSKSLFEKVASTDKTCKWFDGMYHECLNDLNKQQVLSDLTRWIGDRLR